MVSQSKFSVTLLRVWICIAPLLGLFVSRRSCFESRRICFVSRRRCFESRRICFAPFLGLFASRRSCFAPRRELKNAIWTVLVLCTNWLLSFIQAHDIAEKGTQSPSLQKFKISEGFERCPLDIFYIV